MFQQVIVGVEGRPGGRDAIALARLLAGSAVRLTLAHVHDGTPAHASASLALLEREREQADVDGELESVAASAPGRGLHELAQARDADLLVVGSCGRGLAGRVVLGNDTLAALDGSPCAIAIAPRDYAHDLRALATVGVGYDGSRESVAALALARALTERFDARLRALEVVQIPSAPWIGTAAVASGHALDDLVEGARRDLAGLAGVEGKSVIGIAGEELAEFSAHVDLLVLGSRGRSPMRRMLFGSTSSHLATHARAPLLVLPRTAGPRE